MKNEYIVGVSLLFMDHPIMTNGIGAITGERLTRTLVAYGIITETANVSFKSKKLKNKITMDEILKLKIERLELQVKLLSENQDSIKRAFKIILEVLEEMNLSKKPKNS